MVVEDFEITGLKLIRPNIYFDGRGSFCETFKKSEFCEKVANVNFVQDNQSYSKKCGTIRGLHYQNHPMAQGKLVRVISGAVFDVAVDIRKDSPTFGKWVGVELTRENAAQLWIPEGFLHGYCTLSDECEILYKVTNEYSPTHEAGIAFDDPDIGINWPVEYNQISLSNRDKAQPNFRTLII